MSTEIFAGLGHGSNLESSEFQLLTKSNFLRAIPRDVFYSISALFSSSIGLLQRDFFPQRFH